MGRGEMTLADDFSAQFGVEPLRARIADLESELMGVRDANEFLRMCAEGALNSESAALERIADLEADLECCDCADHVVRVASLESEVERLRGELSDEQDWRNRDEWRGEAEGLRCVVARYQAEVERLRGLLGRIRDEGHFIGPGTFARIEAALDKEK
jgi:hypothetical protein